jgi:hypothetical protein
MDSGGRNEKPHKFSSLLVWASVVLQGMGAFLLACGTIVTALAFINKIDKFHWIIILLSGAILSANLGLVCLILGNRKIPARGLPQNIQLPLSREPAFRRDTSSAVAADRSRQRTAVSTNFPNPGTPSQSQLKVIR